MTQKILAVTGSSGLVGGALSKRWTEQGHRVLRVVRRPVQRADEVEWDPQSEKLQAHALAGIDAFVHLAGRGVAERRWNDEFKREIRDSRVLGTRAIVRGLLELDPPPGVVVSASGIGYYGDRGDEWLDETAKPGTGFLSEVCQAWERELLPLAGAVRTVRLRMGMLLARDGGALSRMLLPFRLGLGGPLGGGRHYVSWLALHDLLRIVDHVVSTPMQGPVNCVADAPVTNRVFTQTLARVLGRPALMPLPRLALRVVLGELADEVLSSQRVRPRALLESGFHFERPELEGALSAMLR